ncbi:MAG: hypothetical protein ACLQKY_12510 [Terracidiphilus sp.]
MKFDPGVGRWYLLRPTSNGYTGMAVLDDGGQPSDSDLLPDEQEGQETVH